MRIITMFLFSITLAFSQGGTAERIKIPPLKFKRSFQKFSKHPNHQLPIIPDKTSSNRMKEVDEKIKQRTSQITETIRRNTPRQKTDFSGNYQMRQPLKP